jgi:hypothetical protein
MGSTNFTPPPPLKWLSLPPEKNLPPMYELGLTCTTIMSCNHYINMANKVTAVGLFLVKSLSVVTISKGDCKGLKDFFMFMFMLIRDV